MKVVPGRPVRDGTVIPGFVAMADLAAPSGPRGRRVINIAVLPPGVSPGVRVECPESVRHRGDGLRPKVVLG